MRIIPEATTKRLKDCNPGEFVRPKGWGDDRLALVAYLKDNDDDRILIFLNGFRDSSAPGYVHVAQHPPFVFSLGNNYEFAYDPSTLDLSEGNLWDAPGCLRCNGSDWLMKVRSLEQFPRPYLCYNIITGRVAEEPATTITAYCGKWEIRLKHDDPGRPAPPPLFKFPYKAAQ